MELLIIPYAGLTGYQYWGTVAVILTLLLFIISTSLLVFVPSVARFVTTVRGAVVGGLVFFAVIMAIVMMVAVNERNHDHAATVSIADSQPAVDQAVTHYLSYRGFDVDKACRQTPESVFCGGQDLDALHVPLSGDTRAVITLSVTVDNDRGLMTLLVTDEKINYPG